MVYMVHVLQFTRDHQRRFKRASAARGVTMGKMLGMLIRLALSEKALSIRGWPTCNPQPRAPTPRELSFMEERARLEAELFGSKRVGRPRKKPKEDPMFHRPDASAKLQWVIKLDDADEEWLTRLSAKVRLPRGVLVSKLIQAYFDFRLRLPYDR